MEKEDKQAGAFALAGTSPTFGSRSVDVFAGLDQLEAKHEAYEKVRSRSPSDDSKLINEDPCEDPSSRHDDQKECHVDSHPMPSKRAGYRRQDSGRPEHSSRHDPSGTFRTPRGRPPRPRSVPDHRNNPENWKYYDLSDVSKGDLSEKSNTAAAFDFLRSMQKEREDREENESEKDTERYNADCESDSHCSSDGSNSFVSASGARHVYKRPGSQPARYTCKDTSEEDKPVYRDGKRIQPEYVVGSKPVKARKVTPDPPVDEFDVADSDKLKLPVADASVEQTSSEPVSSGEGDGSEKDISEDSESKVTFKSRRKQSRRQLRTQDSDEDEEG